MDQYCFLCKKKFGLIDEKFGKTMLTNSNIPIPEGFDLEDKLCYKCFKAHYKPDPTPPKDVKKDDSISVIWCLILTFLIPWNLLYYAYRTKHFRIASIIIGIVTAGSIMYFAIPENTVAKSISVIFVIVGIIGFFGSHIYAPIIAGWWVSNWNEKIRSQPTTSSSNT